MVFAKIQFAGAAHHAFRLHPTKLGFFDLVVTGQDGSWKCDGYAVARLKVLCTTNDVVVLLVTSAHLADGEAVGIGMLFALKDLTDNDLFQLGQTASLDVFDFETGEVQGLLDFPGRLVDLDIALEPSEGEFHGNWG